MAKSTNAAVLGVLFAVLFVGVAGLYLTMNVATTPVVIQEVGVQSQGYVPSFAQQVVPKLTQSGFKIFGHGITGADVTQFGTGTVNLSATTDLVMNKSTIQCNATITQGATSAVLNTCNDNGGPSGTPTSGATIVCDGGTNSTATPTTCDGGFLLTNNGAEGQLVARLNASSGPFNDINTYLYNASPNMSGVLGCNSSCITASPSSPVTLTGTNQEICGNFTSGGAVCQCIQIEITNSSNILIAKTGLVPITFEKQDTLNVSTTASC